MDNKEEMDLLKKLRTDLVTFLDELIESFPKEADFVIFRIFLKDKIPIVEIMNYIIFNLCPHEEMVKNRDEKFFLERNVLFGKLGNEGSEKVNHFKNMWSSKNLDKEEKETIWNWFHSFLKTANKYKKLKGL
jgi:hypothetical protein